MVCSLAYCKNVDLSFKMWGRKAVNLKQQAFYEFVFIHVKPSLTSKLCNPRKR